MRKRRILSLGLLGISILILILFEKHLANKLALLGVIFSLIGAWSILHVMIINRKFSIKRKRLLRPKDLCKDNDIFIDNYDYYVFIFS